MAFGRLGAAIGRAWRSAFGARDGGAPGGGTAPAAAPAALAAPAPSAPPEAPRRPMTAGVQPAAKVQDLTGPGISSQWGVNGTDLGIPALTPDGRLLMVFGDTFDGPAAQSENWRSPTALYADPASVADGLRWTGAAPGAGGTDQHAGQLFAYQHGSTIRGFTITTQLPSDVVRLGDALYLQVMACQGLPNVHFTELYKSLDNGRSWTSTGCWWPGDRWNGWFQNVTFCPGDDGYLYCVSTAFSRTQGLMLSRVGLDAVEDADAWEPWGWTPAEGWGWGRPPAQVLTGRFGETCLRRVDGHWLLAAFDNGNLRIDVRLLASPTDDMTTAPVGTLARIAPWGAEDHAHGGVGQLYGGYILPSSTLADLQLVVSQWNTATNVPYRAMQFRGDVSALAGETPVDRRV